MKRTIFLLLVLFSTLHSFAAQPWSQRMVEAHGVKDFYSNTAYKSTLGDAGWDYVCGLVANSVLKTWEMYPEKTTYYTAVKTLADYCLTHYYLGTSNIDDLAAGKMYFALYRKAINDGNASDAAKYKNMVTIIRNTLKNTHSRIVSPLPGAGGFWHKSSYPNQMWLDGLYMGPAVYAQWQAEFGLTESVAANTACWSDIALQFKILNTYTYDSIKQLNYHAWAASPSNENAFWAKQTAPHLGCSPEFWGRSMGWMFAALVDVLELMPKDHPDYNALKTICQQVAAGLKRWQDVDSGVWFQLLQYDGTTRADNIGDVVNGIEYNVGNKPNYLESSCSGMFTYSFFKAVRLGFIDRETYLPIAKKAYNGLIKTFISYTGTSPNINQSCASAGLGPSTNLSRTGTINYYLCGKDVGITSNEGKAIGPFIMASLEYEKYQADSVLTSIGDNEPEKNANRECSFDVPSDGIYLFRFITPDASPYLQKSSCKAGRNSLWFTSSGSNTGGQIEIYTSDGILLDRQNL